MEKTQADFIEAGKEHFINTILPQLQKISPAAVDSMMVFIEGSVSYGFCDENSDVDIDYYINGDYDESVLQRIRQVFSAETYWHESIRVSYGFGGAYWKFPLIVNNEMDTFWNEFNPYALVNIKNAIPIWDPQGLLQVIQKRVAFYPEETCKKVLRGLWATINDSGEYAVLESLKRNKEIECRIYLFRAIEALLRIMYILNGHYYLPTKWLSSGMQNITNDFGIQNMMSEIKETNDCVSNYNSYMKVYNEVKKYMLEKDCIEKECIENYGTIFQKPFFIFNTF